MSSSVAIVMKGSIGEKRRSISYVSTSTKKRSSSLGISTIKCYSLAYTEMIAVYVRTRNLRENKKMPFAEGVVPDLGTWFKKHVIMIKLKILKTTNLFS